MAEGRVIWDIGENPNRPADQEVSKFYRMEDIATRGYFNRKPYEVPY